MTERANNMYPDDWHGTGSGATVGSGSLRRPAGYIAGPTPFQREFGFGRGIASQGRTPTCTSRSNQVFAGAGVGFFRLVQLSLILVLGFVFAACGGSSSSEVGGSEKVASSDSATSSTSTGGTASPDATTQVSDPSAVPGSNETGGPVSVVAPNEDIGTSAATPEEFAKALGAKPIIVVMYQPTAPVDEKVLKNAKAAAKAVKGTVLLAYTPAQYKVWGDLVERLGIFGTPGVAIIKRDGTLGYRNTGYLVDASLLRAALKRAALAKPAKVVEKDAPAPKNVFESVADEASTGKASKSGAATDVSGQPVDGSGATDDGGGSTTDTGTPGSAGGGSADPGSTDGSGGVPVGGDGTVSG